MYACGVVCGGGGSVNRLGGKNRLGLLVMHLCLNPGFLLLLLLGFCVWARSLGVRPAPPRSLPITKTGSHSGAPGLAKDLIRPALLALRTGLIRGTHTQNAKTRIQGLDRGMDEERV